jgi:hypothetical protein
MTTTLIENPSLQQFLEAGEILHSNNFADLSHETVQTVLRAMRNRGIHLNSAARVLDGKATDDDRKRVLQDIHELATRKRVQNVSGIYCSDPVVQARLFRLMLDAEQAGMRFTATDTPLKNYELQSLCEELCLPRDSSVSDLLGVLLSPSALALLQSRAANDYWRLRIVIAATTENQYYWRSFPVTESQVGMGLYRLRCTLKAPWTARCATDVDVKPSLLERITTGASLFAAKDDETLVPNPLLLDDAERNYVTVSSGHGSRYRFDGADPINPPAGPYMTKAEADAEGDAWTGYADTIGGSADTVDVRSFTEKK